MDAMHIKTIGDLARYNVQRLVEVFGKSLGVYFRNAANGVDNEPVQESGEAESISRIATLKQNSCDLAFILDTTDKLAEEILKEVSQKNLKFRQIGIVAVMTDLTTKSRSQTLSKPTRDSEVLRRIVRELFEKFLGETELEVRRVGVKVSGFARGEREQQQLTGFFSGG
jgi:nucleotidyltransferase/DNA polymerase involved in DNA repair